MSARTQFKTKPAILLVDDTPSNLVVLEAVLGTSQYDLVMARSGKEALALAEQRDYAAILLDIHMPDMDGYAVARQLKSNPKTKDVPIIFVTAVYKEEPYVSKGYAAGGVDFFSKPFNPDTLRLKVGIYAELYEKNLILRQKELERETLSNELTTILESLPDAVYVGDENGITRCNQKALDMFGCHSTEECNQHYSQLAERIRMRYPDTDQPIPLMDQPMSRALRGENYVSQIKIRHAISGVDQIIGCAAAPMYFAKKITGAVVVNMETPKLRTVTS